jgi:hypothetical protein
MLIFIVSTLNIEIKKTPCPSVLSVVKNKIITHHRENTEKHREKISFLSAEKNIYKIEH